MGPQGVFIAITAAYTLQGISGAILFRRGRWKTRKIA
jgi:Na+-driven multidrug efflux pump